MLLRMDQFNTPWRVTSAAIYTTPTDSRVYGTLDIDVTDAVQFIRKRRENGVKITMGRLKAPFLREELTSSKRQLTVDRSSVNAFFSAAKPEQIQVSYKDDDWKAAIAIHDGGGSSFTNIGADDVELAIAGRVDVKLAGDWKQMRDFTTWEKDGQTGIFLGGAFNYESGDGHNGLDADYFSYTVDGSVEMYPFHMFAAFIGGQIDDDGEFAAAATPEPDMYGTVIQGGVKVQDDLELFGRYEWFDPDFVDEFSLVTFGVNKFYQGHNAKITFDVVMLCEGDPSGVLGGGVNPFFDASGDRNPGNAFSSGLGFTGPGNADDDVNILVRFQFQLVF